jgi:hypothetical protein
VDKVLGNTVPRETPLTLASREPTNDRLEPHGIARIERADSLAVEVEDRKQFATAIPDRHDDL